VVEFPREIYEKICIKIKHRKKKTQTEQQDKQKQNQTDLRILIEYLNVSIRTRTLFIIKRVSRATNLRYTN